MYLRWLLRWVEVEKVVKGLLGLEWIWRLELLLEQLRLLHNLVLLEHALFLFL